MHIYANWNLYFCVFAVTSIPSTRKTQRTSSCATCTSLGSHSVEMEYWNPTSTPENVITSIFFILREKLTPFSWAIFIFIAVPLCVALLDGKTLIYDSEMCVCKQYTGFHFIYLMNWRTINNWIMHLLDASKKLNAKCIRLILNQHHNYGNQFGTTQSLQLHL